MQTSIHVAGNRIDVPRGFVLGSVIYSAAQVDPNRQFLLLELDDDRDIPLRTTDYIVLSGDERFSIGDGSYPLDDEDPVLRKPITPVMNEKPVGEGALSRSKLSFEQLAQLDPHFEPGDGIFVELRDIPDAQVVQGMRVLVQSGDRFYTSPAGNVGFTPALERDIDETRRLFGHVDCIDDHSRSLIVVHGLPLPGHWNRPETDLLVIAPQGYPLSAMDMFWVTPGLRLKNGQMPKNADQVEIYGGIKWQRFSWHYPPTYRWHPAKDSVMSHLRFARTRLNLAH